MEKSKINNFCDKCKFRLSMLFDRADSLTEKTAAKKMAFVLIVSLSFLSIFLLNIQQPIFGDDWRYSMKDDGHTRLENLSDIAESLYTHYFDWGGRIIVHIVAEVLLLFDFYTIKIINSLVFILFIYIIYKTANRKNNIRPSLLLFIFLAVFFLQPAFSSTLLWITGSANYLWGTLIVLCFLYPYAGYIFDPTAKDTRIKQVLFFLGGVVAGWTNENMAVALIFMLVLFILYCKIRFGKIPVWAITGLAGAIVGATLMIIAPGNYVRMDKVLTDKYSQDSFITIYVNRFIEAVSGYYYYALTPTFIYVIMLCMHGAYGRKDNKTSVRFLSLVFFSGALIATLAMSASPIFPGRAAFGIITLIILATSVLYANLDFSSRLIKRLVYTAVFFSFLFFISEYYNGYNTLREVNIHDKNRLEKVNAGKRDGVKDFVFDDRIEVPDSRFVHYYELTPDSTEWHNRMFSGYHGINSIIVK